MTDPETMTIVEKTLSGNDVGDTKSHQAGVHIPKGLISFFPDLDEGSPNPDAWLELEDVTGETWSCRYIHYNNRVVGMGTRDEYRVTWVRTLLRALGAGTGDVLQLQRVGEKVYRIRLFKSSVPEENNRVVINIAHGWRSVRR